MSIMSNVILPNTFRFFNNSFKLYTVRKHPRNTPTIKATVPYATIIVSNIFDTLIPPITTRL